MEDDVLSEVRENDQITYVGFFSHGLPMNGGEIVLGFDYADAHHELDIYISDIEDIDEKAFAANLKSEFYSCNTGTAGDDSFAQKWVNKFGGEAFAFIGKSDYGKVSDQTKVGKVVRGLIRGIYGEEMFGRRTNLPTAGENAKEVYFYPQND